MRVSRRELLGYAVAGTTGMGITTAARQSRGSDTPNADAQAAGPDTAGVPQHWRLGGVYARPAEIEETAITFRGSVRSNYDTDYEVAASLYYRPKPEGGTTARTGESWQEIAADTAPLSDGVYLEATETGLEAGRTYQYRAEAYLMNYVGESHRVSEVREVTAGEPCSGPSTNCLRAETLAPEVGESESESGGEVTLRGRAKGIDHYDEVTGRFFYQREGENQRWTDFTPVESGGGDGGEDDIAEFSTTLSGLPAGTYTYYAEVRGEGGDPNNMYAEGEKRKFTVD